MSSRLVAKASRKFKYETQKPEGVRELSEKRRYGPLHLQTFEEERADGRCCTELGLRSDGVAPLLAGLAWVSRLGQSLRESASAYAAYQIHQPFFGWLTEPAGTLTDVTTSY
ncbi:uncharacterized protein SPSK_10079 [Sporothrix schenckii 1099-18]|uniref:Uncharacterized protein n=1 Tax=Sporothrix schenckii 1099-18 TaxID=1397361 RepID=A0A0F2M8R7_SPOSC|nr:uncharacterized protein SPSK_10079 [Sporothrix schenckii 1099-18]KJR84561.1 hypothetical protein SPSK_10079 [Sporothrix schenckii 1099-18]